MSKLQHYNILGGNKKKKVINSLLFISSGSVEKMQKVASEEGTQVRDN